MSPSQTNPLPRPERARRPKRVLIAILFLLGVAAAGVWFTHRSPANALAPGAPQRGGPENRVVPVVVAAAERRDLPIYLEAIGNAVPLQTVTVKSQVDGRLDQVLFKEGQFVKKGDVLAQIDPRPFLIQLHQAEAAVLRDTATSRNALRNLDRYKMLLAQNLIPQQQVDDQQMTYDQATATVAADRTQVENARLQLDYARIKSPLDGVTGVRLVDAGNLVHASDPTGIVVVAQLDPMAVLFTLPEDDLPKVSKELARAPLSVEAYTRDEGRLIAKGQLAVIDNQINQATATIRLKAIFANPDRALWPNAFIKARLLLTTRQGTLVIPAQAVQRGPKGTFVYVVDAANKANPRPVTVSVVEDEWAVVDSGLDAGDSVVLEGQNQIRPGAKVAPRTGSPKGAASAAPADRPSGSERPGAGTRHGGRPRADGSGQPRGVREAK